VFRLEKPVERLARRPIPALLLAAPPEARPRWQRAGVARVRVGDFRISARELDTSLDLVALAAKPLSA
jgi:hypothetical protein